ncbi:hypothetical protein ACSBR2_017306 [Camellia fascicularis]
MMNLWLFGSSVWVMMNKETRRLSKIPSDVRGEIGTFFVDSPPVVDEDSRKLPKLDESTADYIRNGLTPRWSDLDVNQHVNNVKYIGWILEFLAESLDVIQDNDWVISLGNAFSKQYELYKPEDEHTGLLHRCLGMLLQKVDDRSYVRNKIDWIYEQANIAFPSNRLGLAKTMGLQTIWLFIRDMIKGIILATIIGPPIVAAIIVIVQARGKTAVQGTILTIVEGGRLSFREESSSNGGQIGATTGGNHLSLSMSNNQQRPFINPPQLFATAAASSGFPQQITTHPQN